MRTYSLAIQLLCSLCLVLGEEYIAFMSRGGTNYLYFTMDGKFVRQLGRKGQEPGEYAGILLLML